jgi:outer membrane protein OmpA-like peptidoglycan-associated protein
MFNRKLVVVAMVLASSFGIAYAADDEARQTISINSPNPKVEDIEGALFPKEVVALKDECAQMEKIGLRCQSVIPKSSLDTIQITFARGSAILTDEGKGFLRSVGAALQRKAGVWKSLTVEGHTDATGTDATNRKLSQQRADSVKTFLQAEFALSNIETSGRSADRLRDTDNPSSGLNRRVEFVPNW